MTLSTRQPMTYLGAQNDTLEIGTDPPGSAGGVVGFQLLDGNGVAPAKTGNGLEASGFAGTLIFEASVVPGVWAAFAVAKADTPGTLVTSIDQTALGIYRGDAGGVRKVRVKCSAYTSGQCIAYGSPPNGG